MHRPCAHWLSSGHAPSINSAQLGIPQAPSLPAAVANHAMLAAGDTIYSLGGDVVWETDFNCSRRVFRLHNDSWRELARMRTPRAAAAAAALDGWLYAIGGETSTAI